MLGLNLFTILEGQVMEPVQCMPPFPFLFVYVSASASEKEIRFFKEVAKVSSQRVILYDESSAGLGLDLEIRSLRQKANSELPDQSVQP